MTKTLIKGSLGFFALALVAAPSLAQQRTAAVDSRAKPPVAAPAPQFQPPAPELQVMMIRSALLALNHANQTNNYSVFAGLAGPGFRTSNSPQKLSQAFEAFRTNNIDLSAVALIPPREIRTATVDAGKLRLIGMFPSQPMQVNYDLSYEPVGGQWKLLNVAVNLAAVQQAQKPPTPTPPAATKK